MNNKRTPKNANTHKIMNNFKTVAKK
jgi:hypothetical protein